MPFQTLKLLLLLLNKKTIKINKNETEWNTHVYRYWVSAALFFELLILFAYLLSILESGHPQLHIQRNQIEEQLNVKSLKEAGDLWVYYILHKKVACINISLLQIFLIILKISTAK